MSTESTQITEITGLVEVQKIYTFFQPQFQDKQVSLLKNGYRLLPYTTNVPSTTILSAIDNSIIYNTDALSRIACYGRY